VLAPATPLLPHRHLLGCCCRHLPAARALQLLPALLLGCHQQLLLLLLDAALTGACGCPQQACCCRLRRQTAATAAAAAAAVAWVLQPAVLLLLPGEVLAHEHARCQVVVVQPLLLLLQE
jgi:hypothetical protein